MKRIINLLLIIVLMVCCSACNKDLRMSKTGSENKINAGSENKTQTGSENKINAGSEDRNQAGTEGSSKTSSTDKPRTATDEDIVDAVYYNSRTDQKIVAFKTSIVLNSDNEDDFVYVLAGEDASGQLWSCSTPLENTDGYENGTFLPNISDCEEGTFLLITADVTLETGGEDGRQIININALKDIRTITLEEAQSYINIENFFEQKFEGVSGIVAYPAWEDCVFYGNIYDLTRKNEKQKDFVGYVKVYHDGFAATYNRMAKVNEYTVFYNYTCEGGLEDAEYKKLNGFENWRETQTYTPEFISEQSIAELLSTGSIYNEVMFVMVNE